MAKKRARTAIVSGGLEPVADTGRGGHSVFANAFLSVLRDNNDVLDGQSLFQRLRSRVVVNADQTPQYSTIRRARHEGGDFLFVPRGQLGKAETKPAAPSLSSNQAELLFWNSIKDSRDADSYQAYIDQYPNGSFAGLARVRLKKLQPKQTVSLEPAIVLEPIEGIYVAVRNANVRTAPNVSAGKVATLAKGSEIYVPGKVAGRNWMAVDRDGKRLGYVFSNLLQDKEVFEAARIEDARKRKKTEANKKEAALWRKQLAARQARRDKAMQRQASLAPRSGIQKPVRPQPVAKSGSADRFDGHWKASLINCSTTDYAGVVSYEIELQVTKGTYDLAVVTIATNYDANVAKELSSLSGTVSSNGQIENRVPAGIGSANVLVFTADLSAIGGEAWMSIDNCRVALKAPAKVFNLQAVQRQVSLIPDVISHDTFVHSRRVMEVILSGVAVKSAQASQQASTISS
ncbi:MAG: SH3 domain-containing protein [Alphaproteobacteria bacterium]